MTYERLNTKITEESLEESVQLEDFRSPFEGGSGKMSWASLKGNKQNKPAHFPSFLRNKTSKLQNNPDPQQ